MADKMYRTIDTCCYDEKIASHKTICWVCSINVGKLNNAWENKSFVHDFRLKLRTTCCNIRFRSTTDNNNNLNCKLSLNSLNNLLNSSLWQSSLCNKHSSCRPSFQPSYLLLSRSRQYGRSRPCHHLWTIRLSDLAVYLGN